MSICVSTVGSRQMRSLRSWSAVNRVCIRRCAAARTSSEGSASAVRVCGLCRSLAAHSAIRVCRCVQAGQAAVVQGQTQCKPAVHVSAFAGRHRALASQQPQPVALGRRAGYAARCALRQSTSLSAPSAMQPMPPRPPPNPSFELTLYSVPPCLPRACASRIVALASQGATLPRAAQFQR